jgi:hypothetical protein
MGLEPNKVNFFGQWVFTENEGKMEPKPWFGMLHRTIDKYPEKGRERFLTADELGRLGDAIREAETVGLPWAVDDTKPTAKHAPKEPKRRTVFDPVI